MDKKKLLLNRKNFKFSFSDNLIEKKKNFNKQEINLNINFDDINIDKALALSLAENFNLNKKECVQLIKETVLTKPVNNSIKTEIKNLDQQINNQIKFFGGRKIISNEGGGNCLFHSLSSHLKVDYQQLREDSVNYITCSWDRFKDFALNPETLLHFNSKEEYQNYMIKDGSWGDHLSLLALCELYQVNAILIISEGNKLSEPVKINVGSEINVLIRFNSEFHYEAII